MADGIDGAPLPSGNVYLRDTINYINDEILIEVRRFIMTGIHCM